MRGRLKWRSLVLIGMAVLTAGAPVLGRNDDRRVADHVEKSVREAIEIRQKAQQQEDQWRSEKQKRMALYDSLLQAQSLLKTHRGRLLQEKKALEARIAAKTRQLKQMQQISEQIRPYLDTVMLRLRRFLDRDTPFLAEERRRRLEKLKSVLDEPDIAVGEKARKLMEALMVEAEYGQTVEVYREEILVAGQPVLVDVFRLGRVALFYQSLTGQDCGYYHVGEKAWRPLPGKYKNAVRSALEIGSKTRPAELVSLPIGRLEVR